jgi:hypothetical protein
MLSITFKKSRYSWQSSQGSHKPGTYAIAQIPQDTLPQEQRKQAQLHTNRQQQAMWAVQHVAALNLDDVCMMPA